MDGGSQVRQGSPINVRQRNFDGGALGQGFQIAKNPGYQVVVLAAPIPANVGQNDALIFHRTLPGLTTGFFSHTLLILKWLFEILFIISSRHCQEVFLWLHYGYFYYMLWLRNKTIQSVGFSVVFSLVFTDGVVPPFLAGNVVLKPLRKVGMP